MSLRLKIFSGFLLMAALIVVSGIVAVKQFSQLRICAMDFPAGNGKVTAAAVEMLDAIDRESMGILVMVAGDIHYGHSMLGQADRDFNSAFETVRRAVAEPGAVKAVGDINSFYDKFKTVWEPCLSGRTYDGNMAWYLDNVAPLAGQVKRSIKRLMDVNRAAMYESFVSFKKFAERAVRSMVVGVVALLLFILVFNFFINFYVIEPICKLRRSVEACARRGEEFTLSMEGRNELAGLEGALRELIINTKQNVDDS